MEIRELLKFSKSTSPLAGEGDKHRAEQGRYCDQLLHGSCFCFPTGFISIDALTSPTTQISGHIEADSQKVRYLPFDFLLSPFDFLARKVAAEVPSMKGMEARISKACRARVDEPSTGPSRTDAMISSLPGAVYLCSPVRAGPPKLRGGHAGLGFEDMIEAGKCLEACVKGHVSYTFAWSRGARLLRARRALPPHTRETSCR